MPRMTKEDDPKTYIEAFERTAIQTGLDRDWDSILIATSSDNSSCFINLHLKRGQLSTYILMMAPDWLHH
ncbi:hypothetical protein Y1Q_0004059 [Alligator mississippiensis]|uniref:Uncharacterized protein n=1 Tax=Alligator mississippiensis TaxID=8496 RepID=A0A151PHT6_ALLMI|nr:hypothetical protein Y1Q_0004059 [Alligator mississippiensis]